MKYAVNWNRENEIRSLTKHVNIHYLVRKLTLKINEFRLNIRSLALSRKQTNNAIVKDWTFNNAGRLEDTMFYKRPVALIFSLLESNLIESF